VQDIGETLKKIGDAMSRASTPTTSKAEKADEESCPICGGAGFVYREVPVGHPDFGKAFPCVCQLARQERDWVERLRHLGGLDALADKTFATFVPEPAGLTPDQAGSLRIAYERAARYAEHPEGWLLLQGGYGCGKTHLAAAIANRQVEQGLPALFVGVPDLLDYLRATYGPTSEVSYDERFEQIRSERLLILDDLGAESPTPWAQEKLYQIFNHRYLHELPTVITINVELDRLDPRIRSRLVDRDLTRGVLISAPDYRRSGATTDQSEISSLALYAHMTFDTFGLRPRLSHDQRENLKIAYQTARAYAENPESWLVFMGTYGCGKTHLAASIANHRQAQGYPVLFVTVPDLLDHLRATYSPSSTVSYDKRFHQIRTAPLLILDDLGTESATPWAREKLFQIIDHRYAAQAPTVFTTVYDGDELRTLIPRLSTRILDERRCNVVGIMAPSYRGGTKRRSRRKR
jgi:DNA replication protein DnaC